jgi:hypothetical protein
MIRAQECNNHDKQMSRRNRERICPQGCEEIPFEEAVLVFAAWEGRRGEAAHVVGCKVGRVLESTAGQLKLYITVQEPRSKSKWRGSC